MMQRIVTILAGAAAAVGVMVAAPTLTGHPFSLPGHTADTDLAPLHASRFNSDGHPTQWATCRISMVVNPDGAPAGALSLIREAAREVSAATGMTIRITDTDSTLTPAASYGVKNSGPVIVSFGVPGQVNVADHTYALYTGRVGAVNGTVVYWAGMLTINTATWAPLGAGSDGRGQQLGTVLHEMLHMVGFGHSTSPASLMYPQANGISGITDDVTANLSEVVPSQCRRPH